MRIRDPQGSGVLAQNFGSIKRPVAYYSVQLDPVARGTVPCLPAVASIVEIMKCSRDLVLGHPLILKVPHDVFAMLLKSQTQAFAQQHLAQYEAKLFTSDHISFECCTSLNPATLLPTEQLEDIIHDCQHLVQDVELSRPDLSNISLKNPDHMLFNDGSSYIHEGTKVSGVAVVSLHEII